MGTSIVADFVKKLQSEKKRKQEKLKSQPQNYNNYKVKEMVKLCEVSYH